METIRVNMTPCEDVQTIHASQNDNEAREWGFELHNNGELIDTSDVTEQMFFKAYKGGTEQILPENGSTPTTSPFLGDIKYPQGLLTDQEFLYRESPTEEDGLAKITDIKGNTLVWNQLVENGDFSASSGWTGQFATVTISNGVASVSQDRVGDYVALRKSNLQGLTGHKYLVVADVKSAKKTAIAFYLSNTYSSAYDIQANTRTVVHAIITVSNANTGGFNIYTNRKTELAEGDVVEFYHVMLFDLTQMGLDISNPSEFTSLFSKPYYDYCQGAMLSFGGRNVKFNQLFAQNYSVTFETGNTSAKAVHRVTGITKGHKCILTWVQNKTLASNTRNTPNITYSNGTNQQVYQDASSNRNLSSGKYGWVFNVPTDNINNWIDFYYWVHSPSAEVTMSSFNLIDLTEMFGVGNEPSAEGFLELFTDDYYEYNVGQYMNLGQPVSLKTTGKNLIKNDYVGRTVTVNGVTAVFNADGSVTLNGTTTAAGIIIWNMADSSLTNANTQNNGKKQLKNGTYIMSGGIDGKLNVQVRVSLTPSGGDTGLEVVGSGQKTVVIDDTYPYNWIRLMHGNAVTFNNETVYPMIRYADTDDTFEPYKESALPIPLDEFPNGMDGINNAKDEKNETEYIKRTAYIKFDGSQAWSTRTTSGGSVLYECIPYNIKNVGTQATAQILNNRYPWNTSLTEDKTIRQVNTTISVRRDDITSLQAWYSELASNPLEIVYQLATPLENYGIVDLGTLTYTRVTNKRYQTTDLADLCKWGAQGTRQLNLLCSKFITGTSTGAGTVYGGDEASKTIYFWTNEDEYQSADAFKSAMSGVYLLYEKESPQGFTTATLVTENGEVALANENGVLVGKCNSDVSADAGFIEGKIKLSDSDGDVYSNKIQIHVERSPQ